jgi:methylenetetrahydrofolate reductase (NADPH)
METLQEELENPRYEVLPFTGKNTDEKWSHLPEGATVTVTTSPNIRYKKDETDENGDPLKDENDEPIVITPAEMARKGQNRTMERAATLAQDKRHFHVIPHLAARSIESEDHLEELLGKMGEVGITRAFIVGGDAKDTEDKPFHRSLDLIKAIRERKSADELELGCTAYPDGHSKISREDLETDLLEKQAYDLGYCATQLCFNPNTISRWAKDMQHKGLHLPVKVSIPGDLKRMELFDRVKDLGINDSASFVGKNPALLKQFFIPGGFKPDRLVKHLAPELDDDKSPITGFHLAAFNAIEATEAWRERTLAKYFGNVVALPALESQEASSDEQAA